MTNVSDLLLKAARKPIDTKAAYGIDDVVRVRRFVIQDGQTPTYWIDSDCVVVRVHVGGCIAKRWVYTLQHPNTHVCEFYDEEIKTARQ